MRRAFTLVEMLVVVAIIGIITSLALGTMYAATERARGTRTRSLIRKLETELWRRIEHYETRRVPIQMNSGEDLEDFGEREVMARRELMRMELPDRYSDILFVPNEVDDSPVRRMYRAKIAHHAGLPNNALLDDSMGDDEDVPNRISAQNQSAEMLYVVLSCAHPGSTFGMAVDPKYIADTDGDGMLEYVDGWGQPISWLRWPAGYLNVDLTGSEAPWGFVTDLQSGRWPVTDGEGDPDPFNTRMLDIPARWEPATTDPTPPVGDPFLKGYRTAPLIVSPGPDGVLGLALGRALPDDASEADIETRNANYSDPYYFWSEFDGLVRRGTPRLWFYDSNDFATAQDFADYPKRCVWVHFDNITNHLQADR